MRIEEIAAQHLADRSCDTCRYRSSDDLCEEGMIVHPEKKDFVNGIFVQYRRDIPEERTCNNWEKSLEIDQ